MRRVVICSPWRGDTELNRRYLDACLRDSYARGEAPFASHAIGPRVLDDDDVVHRMQGMRAGRAWIVAADAVAVYIDLGSSEGMRDEIRYAKVRRIPIEYRRIGGEWDGRR